MSISEGGVKQPAASGPVSMVEKASTKAQTAIKTIKNKPEPDKPSKWDIYWSAARSFFSTYSFTFSTTKKAEFAIQELKNVEDEIKGIKDELPLDPQQKHVKTQADNTIKELEKIIQRIGTIKGAIEVKKEKLPNLKKTNPKLYKIEEKQILEMIKEARKLIEVNRKNKLGKIDLIDRVITVSLNHLGQQIGQVNDDAAKKDLNTKKALLEELIKQKNQKLKGLKDPVQAEIQKKLIILEIENLENEIETINIQLHKKNEIKEEFKTQIKNIINGALFNEHEKSRAHEPNSSYLSNEFIDKLIVKLNFNDELENIIKNPDQYKTKIDLLLNRSNDIKDAIVNAIKTDLRAKINATAEAHTAKIKELLEKTPKETRIKYDLETKLLESIEATKQSLLKNVDRSRLAAVEAKSNEFAALNPEHFIAEKIKEAEARALNIEIEELAKNIKVFKNEIVAEFTAEGIPHTIAGKTAEEVLETTLSNFISPIKETNKRDEIKTLEDLEKIRSKFNDQKVVLNPQRIESVTLLLLKKTIEDSLATLSPTIVAELKGEHRLDEAAKEKIKKEVLLDAQEQLGIETMSPDLEKWNLGQLKDLSKKLSDYKASIPKTVDSEKLAALRNQYEEKLVTNRQSLLLALNQKFEGDWAKYALTESQKDNLRKKLTDETDALEKEKPLLYVTFDAIDRMIRKWTNPPDTLIQELMPQLIKETIDKAAGSGVKILEENGITDASVTKSVADKETALLAELRKKQENLYSWTPLKEQAALLEEVQKFTKDETRVFNRELIQQTIIDHRKDVEKLKDGLLTGLDESEKSKLQETIREKILQPLETMEQELEEKQAVLSLPRAKELMTEIQQSKNKTRDRDQIIDLLDSELKTRINDRRSGEKLHELKLELRKIKNNMAELKLRTQDSPLMKKIKEFEERINSADGKNLEKLSDEIKAFKKTILEDYKSTIEYELKQLETIQKESEQQFINDFELTWIKRREADETQEQFMRKVTEAKSLVDLLKVKKEIDNALGKGLKEEEVAEKAKQKFLRTMAADARESFQKEIARIRNEIQLEGTQFKDQQEKMAKRKLPTFSNKLEQLLIAEIDTPYKKMLEQFENFSMERNYEDAIKSLNRFYNEQIKNNSLINRTREKVIKIQKEALGVK